MEGQWVTFLDLPRCQIGRVESSTELTEEKNQPKLKLAYAAAPNGEVQGSSTQPGRAVSHRQATATARRSAFSVSVNSP